MKTIFSYSSNLRANAEYPEPYCKALLKTISTELTKHRPSALDQQGSEVYFRAGLLRMVTSWNLLCTFSSGRISAHANKSDVVVTYSLAFNQLVAVSTVFALLFAIADYSHSRRFSLVVPIAVWCWFVFGNLIIALPRFRSFIKRCIRITTEQLKGRTFVESSPPPYSSPAADSKSGVGVTFGKKETN